MWLPAGSRAKEDLEGEIIAQVSFVESVYESWPLKGGDRREKVVSEMVSLQFKPWHWQQVCIHAELAYPEECCGLLLGRQETTGHPQLEAVWPTHNAWDATHQDELGAIAGQERTTARSRNFAIAPADVLQATRVARGQNWGVVGIYHSHPDHPANPSAFDRAIAWEHYYYLIVSVYQGCFQDARLWQLGSDRKFQARQFRT